MTEVTEKPLITLKFDLLFKKVFGDEKDLVPIRYLIDKILNIKAKKITILNAELIGRPYKDKKTQVDLVVELEDGAKVSVEVNTSTEQKYIDRNIYYMCRNISKDLKEGADYKELNKHIQINLDFKGKHKKSIMRYALIEKETKEELTDMIEIVRIDIPYYRDKCYNEDVRKLDSLTKFLGMFDIEDKNLLDNLSKGDENMEDIVKRIEKYNDDEDVIGAYDYEAKMRLLADIREEKGIEKKTKEIAKNMLKENIDINTISKVTGLSIQDINELK